MSFGLRQNKWVYFYGLIDFLSVKWVSSLSDVFSSAISPKIGMVGHNCGLLCTGVARSWVLGCSGASAFPGPGVRVVVGPSIPVWSAGWPVHLQEPSWDICMVCDVQFCRVELDVAQGWGLDGWCLCSEILWVGLSAHLSSMGFFFIYHARQSS